MSGTKSKHINVEKLDMLILSSMSLFALVKENEMPFNVGSMTPNKPKERFLLYRSCLYSGVETFSTCDALLLSLL